MLGSRKVLVVGGGIAGLTLANGLERVGVDYQVLEQAASFSDVGFGITLGLNAMKSLELINPELERRVSAAGVQDTTYALLDSSGNMLYTPPPSADSERNRYGIAQFLPIKRTHLQQELLLDIPKEKIVNSVIAREFHQDDKGVTLIAEDGRTFTGGLIVGADGIHSKIRAQLHAKYAEELGPPPALRYSNYSLWGGQVKGVAVPTVNDRVSFIWSLMGDKKLFLTLPMPGDVQYWSYGEVRKEPIQGSSCERLGHEELKSRLLKEAQGLPSWHADLMEATEEITAWDLFDLPRDESVKRWGHNRVTLMGDAAHAVTPWVGQGGSISMEDAVDLSYRLAHSENWPDAVSKFEEKRLPRAQQIRKAAMLNFESFTATSAIRHLANRLLWTLIRNSRINDAFISYLTKVDFPPEPLTRVMREK